MNSRRRFLQRLTASAIALPLMPYFDSTSERNNVDKDKKNYDGPMLRVAIMGLGSYGTRVADAMQSSTKAKLTGIISGTPSKISAWQTKYNIPEKNCYNYEKPLTGKEAIKKRAADRLAKDTTGNYNVYKVVDLFAEGNSAVEIGSWTVQSPSGAEVDKGHYMSYFQKRDGKWVCVRDMNATSNPAKPM